MPGIIDVFFFLSLFNEEGKRTKLLLEGKGEGEARKNGGE